jgi:hypothetical protein
MRAPLRERVLSRLIVDRSGCLLWTGAKNVQGYGHVWVGRDARPQIQQVHRVVYEMLAGPVPDGFELDHLCRVPLCANPAHMEPVSHRENRRRGRNPALEAWNARARAKTCCPQGHPYDLPRSDGARGCRRCQRAAGARYLARKRADPDPDPDLFPPIGPVNPDPPVNTPPPYRRRTP